MSLESVLDLKGKIKYFPSLEKGDFKNVRFHKFSKNLPIPLFSKEGI